MNSKKRRQAVVFPNEQKILEQLGENIRLAMKRRRITQTMIAERTGLSKPTLRNIERGGSTVSMGHYLRVLAVLGLAEDLAEVASDDILGRKLQDIELLKTPKSSASPLSKEPSFTADLTSNRPDPNSSAQASKPESSQRIQSLMALARSRSGKRDRPSDTTSGGEDA